MADKLTSLTGFGEGDPKPDRQTSTKHETPAGQRANAALRKGMKRPEHGPWPIAKSSALHKKMGKKVGHGGWPVDEKEEARKKSNKAYSQALWGKDRK